MESRKLALTVDHDSDTPLFQQIYEQLRQLILQRSLLPGTRLPTTRQLASQLAIGRGTVTMAYEQLAAEGYTVSRVGAGTYICDDLPAGSVVETSTEMFTPRLSQWGERVMDAAIGTEDESPGSRPVIDFGFGRSFPHIFPYDIWRRLLARYLSTDDTMLSRYGSVAGFHPLREAVSSYLIRLRGVHCTSDRVVIVSGMQQALDIVARLLLNPGDEVLVESPGYVDAFRLFQVCGARLRPLAVDDNGFPVERIPEDCRARFAFVTPSNQFPRGGTMPLARRLALLDWARRNQALVLEDDYDSELRYSGHPVAALQGLDKDGRVIYLGSFSKVLFPALRLGYVVLPDRLLTPFLETKQLIDRGSPTLTQAAVADFIAEGHFERHLRRLRHEYGRRWQALVTALEEHLPDQVSFVKAGAGLHIMIYLADDADEQQVILDAAAAGVDIYSGAAYHLEQPARPSILLGFSGLSQNEIQEGVRRLAAVMHGRQP
jgi:GntR family transcriptional regulator / MocR family aminotransferase